MRQERRRLIRPESAMTVRRVVATTVAGKSTLISDEAVAPVEPPLIGNQIARLWGFDTLPAAGASRPLASAASFFPGPAGFRLVKWTLPPRSRLLEIDDEAAAREAMEAVVPGMANVAVDASGLHRTATIDFQYVLAGEVEFVVDDGKATTLRPGDLVVVDGAAHGWRNRSDRPCVLLGMFYGLAASASDGERAGTADRDRRRP
jgi:mannose-6-phosphate isomerase-like protein (cupin superfamily)